MPGHLEGDRVIIREQAEANRIYNKGGFGRPMSGGGLDLDLVEAAFLVGAGRLKLAEPYGETERFLRAATAARAEFVVESVAYRELREQRPDLRLASSGLRGFGIQFRSGDERGSTRARAYLRAASERTPAPVEDLFAFAHRAHVDQADAIVAIVDEESEVTQYRLTLPDPRGRLPATPTMAPEPATLLRDRFLLPSSRQADALHEREFFGKPVPGGYFLSLVEGLHLAARKAIQPLDQEGKALRGPELRSRARDVEAGLDARQLVYDDLKARDLAVKTGYKFGTHFRAYEEDPRGSHAPFLIDTVAPKDVLEWPQLSRAIRLSHGVRKRLLLAETGRKVVRYLGVERLR